MSAVLRLAKLRTGVEVSQTHEAGEVPVGAGVGADGGRRGRTVAACGAVLVGHASLCFSLPASSAQQRR